MSAVEKEVSALNDACLLQTDSNVSLDDGTAGERRSPVLATCHLGPYSIRSPKVAVMQVQDHPPGVSSVMENLPMELLQQHLEGSQHNGGEEQGAALH